MNKSNEYQKAKDIIETMQLNEQLHINIDSIPNFRKYLREIVSKRNTTQQFTTRNEAKNGLKVIRIR